MEDVIDYNDMLVEEPTKSYNLEQRLIDFACVVIDVGEKLPKTQTGNILGNQLIRSGTSPALNYAETLHAESQKDFAHKLKLVLKELNETKVNLMIISRKRLVSEEVIVEALAESKELVAIFKKSVTTIQNKMIRKDQSNEKFTIQKIKI